MTGIAQTKVPASSPGWCSVVSGSWSVLACVFAGWCATVACSASTADLKIAIQAPPWDLPQPLWRRLTYTISVSNAGPETATQVVVTNQVREQFSDPMIAVSQGTWTLINRNLRCELGELASGNTASVAIESRRRMWPEFSWRRESRRSTSIPRGRTPSIPRPRGCSHVRVFPL